MRTRLIVSSHLDDAALSVWHAVADGPATVVTVFAGVPSGGAVPPWDRAAGTDDSSRLMVERRADDAAMLKSHGARPVHLDFLDEQYRDAAPPTQAIVDALKELVAAHDEVWLPAGIDGCHGDHRIVAEAALAASRGTPSVMYADQPYASRQWSEVVTHPAGATEINELWTQAVLRTCPLAPPRTPTVRQLTDQESLAKRAALGHYTSQLPLLIRAFPEWWSNPGLFEQEWTWELPIAEVDVPPLLQLPNGLADPMYATDGQRGSFLSVIMRTQGKRPELMSAALRSLVSQTNRDFELLVVAHDAGEKQMEVVRRQLDRCPSWLRAHTTVLEARGGTAARPLNVGLRSASGRYVAVLDDDDRALPTWVEEFSRLERGHRGMVFRTGVVRVNDDRAEQTYPPSFDLVDHLVENRSPICGLAFPRPWLSALRISVDESLEVVEDWDLLLRMAPLCGVVASAEVTCHYRDNSGDDSLSRFSKTTWEVARRTVIDKVNSRPILIPPGGVEVLRRDRMRLGALEARLPALDADREALTEALSTVRRQHQDLAARYEDLATFVAIVRNSKSWRWTGPLRRVGAHLRRWRPWAHSAEDQPPQQARAVPE